MMTPYSAEIRDGVWSVVALTAEGHLVTFASFRTGSDSERDARQTATALNNELLRVYTDLLQQGKEAENLKAKKLVMVFYLKAWLVMQSVVSATVWLYGYDFGERGPVAVAVVLGPIILALIATARAVQDEETEDGQR